VVHKWRWLAFAVVAAGFFVIALSRDAYALTSPLTLTWHVLLRKSYSIVAFAIVGALFVWASGASVRSAAIVVALYSGAIEAGQHFADDWEPLSWNAIDVLCGAVGGALGALIPWVRAK
jgi:hypothetical protein